MQRREAVGSILSIIGFLGIFIIAWSAIISGILSFLGKTILVAVNASALVVVTPMLILILFGTILNRRVIAGGRYTAKHLIPPALFAFVVATINLTLFFF